MSAAVASLQKLARDPQWVGGTLPVLAVLHTWTRAMLYHPHVHLLVPAAGVSKEGTWVGAKHPSFLVPGYALSEIFRAKFKAGLKKRRLLDESCPCWNQPWDVHCRHAGSGQKVLDYLGRYVFRIAMANSRLESIADGQVTFRYRDNKTQQVQHVRLPAEQFMERFLQHVLPKGFVKVRTYGLWSARQQPRLDKIQKQLTEVSTAASARDPDIAQSPSAPVPDRTLCPKCKLGHMIFVEEIPPQKERPP
jgi:hypothetical protein